MATFTKFEKILAWWLLICGGLGVAFVLFLTVGAIVSGVDLASILLALLMAIIASLGFFSGLALLKTHKPLYWLGGTIFYLPQIISAPGVFSFQVMLISFKLTYDEISINVVACVLAALCARAYAKRPKPALSILPASDALQNVSFR